MDWSAVSRSMSSRLSSKPNTSRFATACSLFCERGITAMPCCTCHRSNACTDHPYNSHQHGPPRSTTHHWGGDLLVLASRAACQPPPGSVAAPCRTRGPWSPATGRCAGCCRPDTAPHTTVPGPAPAGQQGHAQQRHVYMSEDGDQQHNNGFQIPGKAPLFRRPHPPTSTSCVTASWKFCTMCGVVLAKSSRSWNSEVW